MSYKTKNQNKIQNNRSHQSSTSKKMRAMIFDFHSKMLTEVIKSLPLDIAYWTAGKRDFMSDVFNNKALFPNTIFHNSNDAVLGIPAEGIDVSFFKPLDPTFIKSFFECEISSLIMMDSTDWTQTPLSKKMHLYHVYLKYWYGVLTTLKPDIILFNDPPHMSYKYVVYCLAKSLGIRQLMLRNTQIAGRVLIADDVADCKKLRASLEKNAQKIFSLGDLSPDIRDHYEKKRAVDKSPFYFRAENTKERSHQLSGFLPSTRAIGKNIKEGTFFKTFFSYIRMLRMKNETLSLERFRKPAWAIKLQERKWQKIKNEFKKEYEIYQIQPDYTKKYIYIPLHRQPELSTLTDGDVFIDQLLMIDILSNVIPSDWVIYAKESPLQWLMPRTHVARFKGYTEEIIKKKNVFVVPARVSTFDLIKNAHAVATVNGTPAWEAVLRGKPALVFGYSWYIYCDGMLRVRDMESAKDALKKIQAGYKPDQQKVINFLKAIDEVTTRGYRDERFRNKDDANITFIKNDEENIKSLTAGFLKELRQ
ncbi:MAG: hypothetical protein HYT93_01320 [Parcubacteria group bacterium]|nr:hypothetical protein [Parcubacteria group bacterium]